MNKKLKRYVLTEEIYRLIKRHILNHEWPPGKKINIDELARELGVSNIPIRESLSRLATESLVTFIPYKGMFVTEMTARDLDEIFELRIHLELLALEKAIDVIPDDALSRLEQVLLDIKEEMQEKASVIDGVRRMNESLHGLILDHCGNDTLRRLVRGYIERIERYIIRVHRDIEEDHSLIEWEEHREIVNPLVNRDVVRAKEALQRHLVQSHRRTRPYFT